MQILKIDPIYRRMSKITLPERLARDLDWNLLRVFVVLAQARSVTDAAARLGLKQPTVSSALKRLEDRLGHRLIDRSPGRFVLTAAGQRLFVEALDIQTTVLRLGSAMQEAEDDISGQVTIALASHVVCPPFDATLTAFHNANPRATLSIEVMASRDALPQFPPNGSALRPV